MATFSTLDDLRKLAEIQPACLVGFSGGKDSLAVMDIATRTFKRVVAFHMYTVPGLRLVDRDINAMKERWNVPVVFYPHIAFLTALGTGLYGNEPEWSNDVPIPTLREMYDWIMHDTKIPLILSGAKKSDSMARRRFFANTASWDDIVYPIKDWNKFDVLSYLRAQKIPVPESSGVAQSRIDFSSPSLVWLHDEHPEDFVKLCEWFPYAEAAVKRHQWFGIK